MSSNERFIVISTLDQLIVTYPLEDGVPILHQREHCILEKNTGYSPALPVVLMPNDTIYKGRGASNILAMRLLTRPINFRDLIRCGAYG